jgi:hypothetical protein
MVHDTEVPEGPAPDNVESPWGLLPPVIYDGKPPFQSFGKVLLQPKGPYQLNETVSVQFRATNPRNSAKIFTPNFSFLAVERFSSGQWTAVRTDNDWSTKFKWAHSAAVFGWSVATVEWTIEPSASAGIYRIKYTGHEKDGTPFEGTSDAFEVASDAI